MSVYVYAAPFPPWYVQPPPWDAYLPYTKPEPEPEPITVDVFLGDGPNPFLKDIGKRADEIAKLRKQLDEAHETIRALAETIKALAVKR